MAKPSFADLMRAIVAITEKMLRQAQGPGQARRAFEHTLGVLGHNRSAVRTSVRSVLREIKAGKANGDRIKAVMEMALREITRAKSIKPSTPPRTPRSGAAAAAAPATLSRASQSPGKNAGKAPRASALQPLKKKQSLKKVFKLVVREDEGGDVDGIDVYTDSGFTRVGGFADCNFKNHHHESVDRQLFALARDHALDSIGELLVYAPEQIRALYPEARVAAVDARLDNVRGSYQRWGGEGN